MRLKILTGAAAALLASAAIAGAATLSYVGTGQSATLAGNDLGLGLNGSSLDFISGDMASSGNGLSVSGPARLTYTYLGFEASNTNYAVTSGTQSFDNGVSAVGSTFETMQGAGLLSFAFGTSAPAGHVGLITNDAGATPASNRYAIGYRMLSSTSYLLLFDDIAAGDRDFDDIALQVDVSPVPLPAAGVLLLGGLAGFGAVKRRRKAA